MDSFGLSVRVGPPTSHRHPPATAFFLFVSKKKVMKQIKKIQWQVRWYWFLLVGGRWERFQGRICRFYFQRVTLPVRFWRACGCPPQFRPSIPWWQPFVWRWLVVSGAFGPMHPLAHHPLRRPSRRGSAPTYDALKDNISSPKARRNHQFALRFAMRSTARDHEPPRTPTSASWLLHSVPTP